MDTQLMYDEWNDLIAPAIFRPELAGQPVYLYITNDFLSKIAPAVKDAPVDFVSACKIGLSSVSAEIGLCSKASATLRYWRERPDKFQWPPIIGYLALFSLAAGQYDDAVLNSAAYYQRLWEVINETGTGTYPGFSNMDELWRALCKWSCVEKGASLGILEELINPHPLHVAWPQSQLLLSDGERAELPKFFALHNYNPHRPPRNEALRQALRTWPHLRTRTLQILNNESNSRHNNVLDAVIAELQLYEPGSIEPSSRVETVMMAQKGIQVRLCLSELNETSGRICCEIRLFSPQGALPDVIALRGLKDELVCYADDDGWSSPIETAIGETVDASQLDWRKDLKLMQGARYFAEMKGYSVRLFIRHPYYGWTEEQVLTMGVPFFVACDSDATSLVEQWGREVCDGFRALSIKNLPPGWHLYRANQAHKALNVGNIKMKSERFSIRLQGGLRIGIGNTYCTFAPPALIAEGAEGTIPVLVNLASGSEVTLFRNEESNDWRFPENISIGEYAMEAVGPDGLILRRYVTLAEPQLTMLLDRPFWKDPFGKLIRGEGISVRISGAKVVGTIVPSYPPPTHFANRITYLGQLAGQVYDFPEDPIPNWQPVWAIYKAHKKEYYAVFIGNDNAFTPPIQDRRSNTWSKWKSYFLRRDIKVMGDCGESELWGIYQQQAKNL